MSSGEVTHKTLARLFQAIDHSQLPTGRQDLLAITRHEPFQTMYQHLEHLAEEAGTPRHWNGWELQTVSLHETFDLLLESENWTEISIFDSDAEGTPYFMALLSICRARKKSDQGDHARLLEIEQKLIAAATQQRRREEREKQLDLELRDTLLRLLGTGTDPRAPVRLVDLLDMLTGYLRRLPLETAAGEDPALAEPTPPAIAKAG